MELTETQQQKLATAEAWAALADAYAARHPSSREWPMVMTFYAAMHAIDALLLKVDPTFSPDDDRHEGRRWRVRTRADMRKIKPWYEHLDRASVAVRYRFLTVTENEWGTTKKSWNLLRAVVVERLSDGAGT